LTLAPHSYEITSGLSYSPLEEFMRALSLSAIALCVPLAAQTVDFEKQVQPLLAQKCYACHGEEVQQSGLRLDKRQNAMRGGDYGPVIIAGKSAESKLIKRVINGDGGMQMPPTGALSAAEINTLKAWIDQGAEFRTELKAEAPPKPVDPKVTAVIAAVRSGATADVAKAIAADPALVKAKDNAGSTPLHHAVGFAPIATVKLLIDKGADVNAKNRRASTPLHWAIPDEAKVRLLIEHGANINARQADGRTPLYIAASAANDNAIVRLLLEKGADPNLATANGNTPLMVASGRGDVEAMRLMIDKKADVQAKSGTGATALMGAAGSRNPRAVELLLAKDADVNILTKRQESALANAATAGVEESVKLLLDHGAKVNVPDDRGYSPLMYAAASEAMPAGIVKMLLEKGADVNATGEGETVKTLAAKRGDTEVARLLGVSAEEREQGGIAPLPPASATERPLSEAVQKALAQLEKQSHVFIRTAGCNSCHAQDLPSAAAALARDRGLPAPKEIVQLKEAMNGETPERYMDLIAPSTASLGWELFDRSLNHTPRDEYTDSVLHYLRAMQSPEGYWKGPDGRRPPMNSGDLQTTALAIYALQNFSAPLDRSQTDAALARAATWLTKVQPGTTQERAFHLLALSWANASPALVEHAAHTLAATQRSDGGWNQLPGMGSDAYASGQALFALNTAAKMAPADSVYQKGIHYLLRSQAADGSWHVKTRSIWIQPYFDSGFPYDHDQWISAAGTAWASMALSVSVEEPKVSRK
jgi:ankyrin repeat protein